MALGERKMSKAAERLFEKVKALGRKVLVEWCEEWHREDLYLCFATKEDPKSGVPSEADIALLGKSLSAFLNSLGGLIVFGMTSEAGGDGVPQARSMQSIADVALFKKHVDDMLSQLVVPSDDVVKTVTIPEVDAPDGAGYLVIYVPESLNPPIMSFAGREHRYYRRSDRGFSVMEHFELEDLFGRRPRPNLEFVYRFDQATGDSSHFNFRVLFGLKNQGAGLARFPYLYVSDYSEAYIHPLVKFGALDGHRQTGLPELSLPYRPKELTGYLKQYCGGVDQVIHPQNTLWVIAVAFSFPRQGHVPVLPPITYDFFAEFEFGCEGILKETKKLQISPVDLQGALEAVMQAEE